MAHDGYTHWEPLCRKYGLEDENSESQMPPLKKSQTVESLTKGQTIPLGNIVGKTLTFIELMEIFRGIKSISISDFNKYL